MGSVIRMISISTVGIIIAQAALIAISIFELGGSWVHVGIIVLGGVLLFGMGFREGEIEQLDNNLETLENSRMVMQFHAATMQELDRRGDLEGVLQSVEQEHDELEVNWRSVAERDVE
jgi:hypothetical protein